MQGLYYLISMSFYNALSAKNNIFKLVMKDILVCLFIFYF